MASSMGIGVVSTGSADIVTFCEHPVADATPAATANANASDLRIEHILQVPVETIPVKIRQTASGYIGLPRVWRIAKRVPHRRVLPVAGRQRAGGGPGGGAVVLR